MDHNATLKEALEIANNIKGGLWDEELLRLAELLLSLDDWIRRGGALPDRWHQ